MAARSLTAQPSLPTFLGILGPRSAKSMRTRRGVKFVASNDQHDVRVDVRPSCSSNVNGRKEAPQTTDSTKADNAPRQASRTVAEQDEDMRKKLEERSGGGGEAGLELEDGKPVAMKRGVKANMFRLI